MTQSEAKLKSIDFWSQEPNVDATPRSDEDSGGHNLLVVRNAYRRLYMVNS